MIIKYIKHADVTLSDINEIVKIKMTAWHYPENEQIAWIRNNIQPNDIHVLLLDENNRAVAYLNLVVIDIIINESKTDAYGIGNVCATEKGKGYGSLLMQEINNFFQRNNAIGLLFCKDNLVRFYFRFKWKIVKTPELSTRLNREQINTMIYNYNNYINNFKYQGRNF